MIVHMRSYSEQASKRLGKWMERASFSREMCFWLFEQRTAVIFRCNKSFGKSVFFVSCPFYLNEREKKRFSSQPFGENCFCGARNATYSPFSKKKKEKPAKANGNKFSFFFCYLCNTFTTIHNTTPSFKTVEFRNQRHITVCVSVVKWIGLQKDQNKCQRCMNVL